MQKGLALSFALSSMLLASAACSDDKSATELNPDGPPMVQQVFVEEWATLEEPRRPYLQLAFGDHPDIPRADEDPVYGDNREVNAAVAGQDLSRIRVVVDELLVGNYIEELECSDGSWSKIPVGFDPDDIKKCSGPIESLTDCEGVCITSAGPIGILDTNEDGAADFFRMIDYDSGCCPPGSTGCTPNDTPCDLAVSLECGGTKIPLVREGDGRSFYNPSGNQLLPAVDPPGNLLGLGPAIILQPAVGLKTSSDCTVSFRPEIVDKDGNQVCAPPNGDISQNCTEGDTSAIAFAVEPLALKNTVPPNLDGNEDVPPDQVFVLGFYANIDPASFDAITLEESGGAAVAVEIENNPDAPAELKLTPSAPLTPLTEYVLTISTGLTDAFGSPLPEEIVITFTTNDDPVDVTPDAGPDAMP
ncbi:MAG TPA: Ig-like domain-containing protein [Kofleriaceae bacterium]|nr:Ig-like domain-containing protein [Kofleriaceae bacterium]